jgi:hypothetical protein
MARQEQKRFMKRYLGLSNGKMTTTILLLNMGYYAIRLTRNTQKLCTIEFHWGNYSYSRLPMGIANSPELFESKIYQLMDGLDYIESNLDNIVIVTKILMKIN